MDFLTDPYLAALALGFFLGYMVWYFIKRLGSHTVPALSGLIGVVLGGVVTNVLKDSVPAGEPAPLTGYFIGLAVGLIIYIILSILKVGPTLTGDDPPGG